MHANNTEERHFKVLRDQSKLNNEGVILYRIQATRDSLHAKEGELGGWIEDESNLIGNSAWIANEAQVYGGSIVKGKALVKDNARITFGSRVSGRAIVSERAIIRNATVFEKGQVRGNALLDANGGVIGDAILEGNALVKKALITGKSVVGGDVQIDKPLIINVDNKIVKNGHIVYGDVFANTKSKPSIFTPYEIEMIEKQKHKEKDDKHFELTSNIVVTNEGEMLHQIRATKDLVFPHETISKGELGGYVTSLKSLDNDAWIGKETHLSNGTVFDDGLITAEYDIKDSSDIIVAKTITKNQQARKVKELEKQKPIQIKA